MWLVSHKKGNANRNSISHCKFEEIWTSIWSLNNLHDCFSYWVIEDALENNWSIEIGEGVAHKFTFNDFKMWEPNDQIKMWISSILTIRELKKCMDGATLEARHEMLHEIEFGFDMRSFRLKIEQKN
jgi:hypothetical protein